MSRISAKRKRGDDPQQHAEQVAATAQQLQDCAMLLQSLMEEYSSNSGVRDEACCKLLQSVRSVALSVASTATRLLADTRQDPDPARGRAPAAKPTPAAQGRAASPQPQLTTQAATSRQPAPSASNQPTGQQAAPDPPAVNVTAINQAPQPRRQSLQRTQANQSPAPPLVPPPPPSPVARGLCTVCQQSALLVQNSSLYRVCAACIALSGFPKATLSRCPRANCGAANVLLGKRGWHCGVNGSEPHYVVLEGGVYTCKFSRPTKPKKRPAKR